MKGLLKKFVVLAATALFWSSQANAVLIEIVPSTVGPLLEGEAFVVDIIASDLGGDYISAYDILVAFDAAFVEVDYVQWSGLELGGCFIDSFCGADFGNLAAGLVGAAELSLLWDDELPLFQDGSDFTLFSIGFHALVDFDSTEFSFVWDEFHDVKCAGNEVCFPVSVPEPGTLALLGLGLLGMAASRRRKLAL